VLDPIGGLDMLAGRSVTTAQPFGSIDQSLNITQKIGNVDANSFLTTGRASHDVKYGGATTARRRRSTRSRRIWARGSSGSAWWSV
jgi:hypothetical protein